MAGMEAPVLGLVVLISASLWGFAELAGEVLEGDTRAVDKRILLTLRNPADLSDPIGPGWVEEAGRDITALGGVSVLVLVSLLTCAFLVLVGRAKTALFLALAIGGGILASTLMKLGFDRPRPDLVPHGARVYTASFPSGHSMMAAVTYLTLGALLARTQGRRRARLFPLAAATLVTLLVGVSRLYLGVHWPTDVLAGWLSGGLWASTCWLVLLWLQRRRSVEPREEEPAAARARTENSSEHAS